MTGWIKLHRKLLHWKWYDDIPVYRLFTHLLLTVNHERKSWNGLIVEPGQIVTGRKKLSFETGLSEKQVRTALSKLIESGELVSENVKMSCQKRAKERANVKAKERANVKHYNFSLLTVVSWNIYQQKGQSKGQTEGKKRATTKEDEVLHTSKNSLSEVLKQKQTDFYDELKAYVNSYSKETLRAFYDYWSEPNRSRTKLKHEMQKTWDTSLRLKYWARREKPANTPQKPEVTYSNIERWRPDEDNIDPDIEKQLLSNLKVLTV